MNCRDVEKQVYLYNELLPEERRVVDEHLAHCPSCQAMHRHLLRQAEAFRTLPPAQQPTDEAARLTDRIMYAIGPPITSRAGIFEALIHGFNHRFMRYAMGVASLWLVVFFLYEQRKVPADYAEVRKNESDKPGPRMEEDEPVLNSGAFYEAFKNNRPGLPGEKLVEFYHCMMDCYAGAADCRECKTLYPKLYKKYEDI